MEPSRQDVTRFITDHKPQLTDGVKYEFLIVSSGIHFIRDLSDLETEHVSNKK